ncbi:Protein takeout [Frankliniella fusca]|uniref:Protein takeout n=1 Tax=Frankliniella fusca TaxID=407009 RepID=A0AAE1H0S0_9NEOP|nr:Protein takeout [Frankliniella fusca]
MRRRGPGLHLHLHPALLAWAVLVLGLVEQAPAVTVLQKKPDFLKTCFMDAPGFSQCSKESVQGLFDKLSVDFVSGSCREELTHTYVPGMPEIGIVPMDPLNVTEVRIFQGDGPVNVNAKLNNVKIVGFSGAKIESNTVDPKTYSFVTKLRIPKLRIDGEYTLRGRVLLLPLQGHGTCWFEPRNLDVTSSQDLGVVYRDGQRFFDMKDVRVDFKLGGLKMRMNNLFDGLRSLEETTNTYINSNWRPVAESLHPILTKTIEDILYLVLKQLFDSVPADFFIGDIKDHADEIMQVMVARNIVARHSGNLTGSVSAVLPGIPSTTSRPSV